MINYLLNYLFISIYKYNLLRKIFIKITSSIYWNKNQYYIYIR